MSEQQPPKEASCKGLSSDKLLDPVRKAHLERQVRVDLAAVHRLCHNFQFNEGIDNHLTVMVPGTADKFFGIAYGTVWSEVTASDLLVVNQVCLDTAMPGMFEVTFTNPPAPALSKLHYS